MIISTKDCVLLILRFILIAHFSSVKSETEEELGNVTLRLYSGNTVDDQFHDVFVGEAVNLVKLMNLTKPTVFYIHGFSEGFHAGSFRTIITAYLKRQDHNVIGVSWHELTTDQAYIIVAPSAPGVGQVLSKALNEMVNNSLDPRSLHIVGHSLGAQIAGYIGRNVDFILPRITGLDPAGPAFYLAIHHLTKNDAKFVDLIHTDAGLYGNAIESGSVDFYPNGGSRVQPGCPRRYFPFKSDDFCSHRRSWAFYAESVINETAFVAVECYSNLIFLLGGCRANKKVVMGFGVPLDTKGTFYLTTNAESPYGKGENGV